MTTDEFISAVQERVALDDRDEVSDLISVVLKTFSEILYRTERDKVSAPLPKELKNLVQAAPRQNTRRDVDRYPSAEFLNRVRARTSQNMSQEKARSRTSEVFVVLTEAVGSEALSNVVARLPSDYDTFFPFSDSTSAEDTAT